MPGPNCAHDWLQVLTSSLQESVLSLVYVQRPYWKCFQYQGSFSLGEVRGEDDPRVFTPSLSFRGHTGARPLRFPTRDPLPPRPPETLKKIADKLLCLRQKEVVRSPPGSRLCLVYDQGMEQHHSLTEGEHPERPERIRRVWEMLGRAGVVQRSTVLQSRVAQREEVALVHTQDHVDFMFGLEGLGGGGAADPSGELQVVEEVMAGGARAGVAVIRPPGHHAEPDRPHGFCFYNNVAVAARHATHNLGCQRVLIVDWDVHHGNGIQHAFEDDPRVLYMSLHRYDHGMFFPSSEDANFDRVGTGAGQGYTINIPWNKDGEMRLASVLISVALALEPAVVRENPPLRDTGPV
ncbi:Histone deacetylase 5 [Chionoecetes opilio]|uniref:Histone deacetylase 5 n=1 Tax=Chionoecetes opilio TaxID=41210 RepID=A0A8J4Y654_CHIOP|nr:Histone deacetylase 5 [Chionoecetes opilio]